MKNQIKNMNQSCPFCSYPKTRFKLTSQDLNQQINNEAFSYYECPKCSLIYIHPVPLGIEKFYQSNYPPYSIPKDKKELEKFSKNVKFRLEIIKKFVKKGILLEIGPSFGNFAYLAKKNGFDVSVIEMSKECCNFINSELKIKTHHTNNVLETIEKCKIQFDVVAMWHNIEHLENFDKVLDMISHKVKKNGIIAISAPNPNSIQFKLFKEKWVHLDAPRHLYLIPYQALIKFMQTRKFSLVLHSSTDEDTIKLNRMGWKNSLAHFSTFLSNIKLSKIIGFLIWVAMLPIESKKSQASCYTLVFQKNNFIMNNLAVVHLVRKINGLDVFKSFFKSYQKYPAGIKHQLILVFKGFKDKNEAKDYYQILSSTPFNAIFIEDYGFDIRAYFCAAEKFDYEYFCFLNSFSLINSTDWLKKLYQYIQSKNVGMVGATGSYESRYTDLIIGENKFKLSDHPTELSTFKKFFKFNFFKLNFDSYPNPHLRTNAFLISRKNFLSFPKPYTFTKIQACMFESGKNGLSKFLIHKGLKLLIVGKDGKAYEMNDWYKANTFRSKDQKNILIKDNQTEFYKNANSTLKSKLSYYAWMK